MDVFEFPFGLMTFFGFVMVLPPWMWFLSSYPPAQQLSLPSTFLAGIVLPATLLLAAGSWLEGGARG